MPERDGLLDIVIEILKVEGYDAVQLREVARRARTSLATIYKRFPTREDLILAALEVWLDENRYSDIAIAQREPADSLYAGLAELFRAVFQPWEQQPGMLTAYFRARSSPRGQRLFRRGLDIVGPVGMALMADVDDDFVADMNRVISSVVYGLLGRFVAGEIAITDIVPILDRTLYWMTQGYEARELLRISENRGGPDSG